MDKIEKIKEYVSKFSSELISIDDTKFITRCLLHNSNDVHNTKTFIKNYIKRNASPCKTCRRNLINEKIKNSVRETLSKKFSDLRKTRIEEKRLKLLKDFNYQIEEAKRVHNNCYSYEKVTIDNFKKNYWTITCPIHGDFQQLKKEHLRGHKCFNCYRDSISFNYEIFVKNFIKNDAITIEKDDYKGYTKLSRFKCKKHGYFYSIPENLVSRGLEKGCKKCFSNKSLWEEEIYNFLISMGINDLERNKKIKFDNFVFEIDIYSPSKNIGIECNGLYWHSDIFVEKNYHINKTNICEKIGIKLVQIFEDEWTFKRSIVQTILCNLFGIATRGDHARSLNLIRLTESEAKKFYDKFHIQGWCRSSLSIGAFSKNGDLVGCMSFSNKRPGIGSKTNSKIIELTRYATDGKIYPGLASKLFKFYLRNFHEDGDIISYADRRFYSGGVYKILGFEEKRKTGPNYWYIVNNKRYHRFNYSKWRLIKIFGSEVTNFSEKEIMTGFGLPKIYDCGHTVFLFKTNSIKQN